MSACKSCGASMFWVVNDTTGKLMPLDATPTPDGNVVLAGYALYRGRRTRQAHVLHADEETTDERYTSHFATCPHADQHRRR